MEPLVPTHQMKPSANQAATCISTKLKRNGRGQGTRLTSHQMAPAIAIAMPPLNPPAMRSSPERPRPNLMLMMIGRAAFVCDSAIYHSTYSTCHSANGCCRLLLRSTEPAFVELLERHSSRSRRYETQMPRAPLGPRHLRSRSLPYFRSSGVR